MNVDFDTMLPAVTFSEAGNIFILGGNTIPGMVTKCDYQGSVLWMSFLCLCDKTLAEGAVQETFVKIYRGLNRFHGQSSIKTRIMKIAIHACCDMNHSGWFRYSDRRSASEMLPEAEVPSEVRDEELIMAVMRLLIKLREAMLLFYCLQ